MPTSTIRVTDGFIPWALVTQVGAKGDTGSGGGAGVTDGDKGDVTVSSTGATWTVKNDSITNAKAANMTQATIKGRASGAGTGDPTDLTASQVKAIIGQMGTADIADEAVTLDKIDSAFQTELDSKVGEDDTLALVLWNASTHAWAARPAGAARAVFSSTDDASATTPTDVNLAAGDVWDYKK